MSNNAFGIKEVMDLTFYSIDEYGNRKKPVLVLDTLKVSTVESVAEQTDAKGGKGNADLIIWDHSREITVNVEDAVFTQRSLAMLCGVDLDQVESINGKDYIDRRLDKIDLAGFGAVTGTEPTYDPETGEVQVEYEHRSDGTHPLNATTFYDARLYNANDDQIRVFSQAQLEAHWDEVDYVIAKFPCNLLPITISANSFPGVYYVKGTTYARSMATGKDELFEIIIPRAKIQSETTISMEAEGDPSTLSMTLRALRDSDGVMMMMKKEDKTIVEEGELAPDKNGNRATYTITRDGTLTISGNGAAVGTGEYEYDGAYAIIDCPPTFTQPNYDKVVIEEGITEIDKGLLKKVSANAIYLPASLKKVGILAADQTKFKEVHVADVETFANLELEVELINSSESEILPGNEGAALYYNDKGLSEIKVDKWSYVGLNHFNNIQKIKSKTFSQTETIDGYGYESKSLQEIEFENISASFPEYLFSGCSSLKTIIVHGPRDSIEGAPWGAPEGVEVIWTEAV